LTRSRVNAGFTRAKARGVKLGRPKVGAKLEAAIRKSPTTGIGILKAARTVGASSGAVQRIKAELRPAQPHARQSAVHRHKRLEPGGMQA